MDLALLGKGNVAPNPLVGCVIVRKNNIVGEGYHRKYGFPHAEPNALASVADPSILAESTLYVNLEPCNHFGNTPPCSQAIVEAGIQRVVIANKDPNKVVSGKGIDFLERAGIEVITGILENEGEELNRRFFTYHRKKRPYVILKWAQTADGFIDKIRSTEEEALQISNRENVALVHKWRSEEPAILVGMNTIMMDNPSLTVRHVNGRNPLRVSIDSEKSVIPTDNYSFYDQSTPTLIFSKTTSKVENSVEYKQLPSLDLENILSELHERKIQSVIVEGGRSLLTNFIENELWDEARITSSELIIKNGIKAPTLKGELKNEFTCGKDNIVSLLSPLKFS